MLNITMFLCKKTDYTEKTNINKNISIKAIIVQILTKSPTVIFYL